MDEPKCPAKRSPINPKFPPRKCVDECARFEYAVHLTDKPWIKPKISGTECPNFIKKEAK